MVNVVKLSDARKKREKEERTKSFQDSLERIYGRPLSANEETNFAKLSEDEQIDELLYRGRIVTGTNLVPWASDEEVEAWHQKYFWKKREK